ncbi:MAG: hypothetical protein ACLQVF_24410 [Isosphaeraceae bacterium]
MTAVVQNHKANIQLLSPPAPEKPGDYDDAISMLALPAPGAADGSIGSKLAA